VGLRGSSVADFKSELLYIRNKVIGRETTYMRVIIYKKFGICEDIWGYMRIYEGVYVRICMDICQRRGCVGRYMGICEHM
jgi:hypothetical protein